ncbi:UDP-N-acetylmuramoyl-L-alanyl-D-glutamate--2,6-diaminopimelate ligase [Haloflavibacter putidus]|uniref:UDP-N-acetylmuramoyl-L-alanyl-D-glutamate--2,6-diaminopimelate ligase n=1 Tax=Haloflavibacter putidus TaxID=2576776 RepID=A0A507ZS68_9FLAO|nr:UDP-N-acetylmuramoyl-L-alanyl-D-glutamate--2,6-diaminopimelate ligase [Haloflavibacter putidus]TQD39847.1 UDP-N-acetylmuramoyl-L-alanyl-D-glutamate--2,6-diaminopimelate ligase [Haloflavibacter putidus]
MIQLKDILYKVEINSVVGNTNIAVGKIEFDSRKVQLNDVFVAIRGSKTDGHSYIEQAAKNGALVIVAESLPEEKVGGITYVEVNNSQRALALIASNYYQNPSQDLKLVGVTGTNGKTTIATLLHELFTKAGFTVGLISTVAIKIGTEEFPTKLTTPDSLQINRYLDKMNKAGAAFCFMEVSSHGIDQHRTSGLEFAGGIFTNLSHDHLDYHKNFAEYRDVKKRFFDELPANAFALVNIDDKNGRVMLQNTRAKQKTYALKTIADYKGQIMENQFSGLLLKLNNQELWTKLIGNFNAYNVLAVYAAADLLGLENLENLRIISELSPVEGRFEHFISDKKITAIVDYAHTPDALKNVLETINSIRTKNETLITVVGCGGDRDASKRPKMGHVASALSDKVVFTSDNPRTEDPDKIIEDVEAGVQAQNTAKTLAVTNRRQAIKTACTIAKSGDIILIAGKGHETYQEINNKRHDFDDLEIVKEILTALNK